MSISEYSTGEVLLLVASGYVFALLALMGWIAEYRKLQQRLKEASPKDRGKSIHITHKHERSAELFMG
jgi:hypothetical protein